MLLANRAPSTPRARRRGAASVEFAVVSLAFFTLVIALVELGRGLMCNYLLTNAARQACRAGVVPGRTTEEIKQTAADALADGRMTGATVNVAVNGASADASAAQSGDQITVLISVPVESVTWVPGSKYLKGTLSGQYTLRRE